MTKVGIIGAGQWSTRAALGAQRRGFTIDGIYAPDDSAKVLAEKVGGKVATSPEALFASSDTILIGSPTDTHLGYVKQAVAAGKPALVASPVAPTSDDAVALLAAAEGGRVAASFPLRFRPEYQKLKDAAGSGQLGTIGMVRLGVCRPAPADWRADYKRSGGPGVETGAHALDLLGWAFGPIERVYGLGSPAGARNYNVLTGRLASGAVFHLEVSWAEAPGTSYDYYEVAGSNGLIEFDSRRDPVFLLEGHGNLPGADPVSAGVGAQPADFEMEDFRLFCQGEPSRCVDLKDAVAGIELAVRVAQGVESGQVVTL